MTEETCDQCKEYEEEIYNLKEEVEKLTDALDDIYDMSRNALR